MRENLCEILMNFYSIKFGLGLYSQTQNVAALSKAIILLKMTALNLWVPQHSMTTHWIPLSESFQEMCLQVKNTLWSSTVSSIVVYRHCYKTLEYLCYSTHDTWSFSVFLKRNKFSTKILFGTLMPNEELKMCMRVHSIYCQKWYFADVFE